MALNGKNNKLGERSAPWGREVERMLLQILNTLVSIQKDIAYLKQRVK